MFSYICSDISVLFSYPHLHRIYPILQFLQQFLQVVLLVLYYPDQLQHLVVFLLLLIQVLVSISKHMYIL